MYDWFDDDYIKGGKLPIDKGHMTVPEGQGLGVELDEGKVNEYHEKYRETGTFAVFGVDAKKSLGAHVPLWPSC